MLRSKNIPSFALGVHPSLCQSPVQRPWPSPSNPSAGDPEVRTHSDSPCLTPPRLPCVCFVISNHIQSQLTTWCDDSRLLQEVPCLCLQPSSRSFPPRSKSPLFKWGFAACLCLTSWILEKESFSAHQSESKTGIHQWHPLDCSSKANKTDHLTAAAPCARVIVHKCND